VITKIIILGAAGDGRVVADTIRRAKSSGSPFSMTVARLHFGAPAQRLDEFPWKDQTFDSSARSLTAGEPATLVLRVSGDGSI
jgi:hypothetical protein